jgi:hypothetical protein
LHGKISGLEELIIIPHGKKEKEKLLKSSGRQAPHEAQVTHPNGKTAQSGLFAKFPSVARGIL